MKSTFSRALTGFIVLTGAVSLMALVALWTVEKYVDGHWLAGLLVILVALVTVAGIYGSTLHTPIKEWIGEPKREKERLAEKERLERKDA